MMKNLYLDIDRVLISKNRPDDIEIMLAKHAKGFLRFCYDNFQCYWPTAHCNEADSAPIIKLEYHG